ncbi:putative RNA methyltransferase [Streptomyces avicenniae]|uniref:putative RNA methyltransferase n=1 Tax=Streptomyces avicenniae TaxID=500153 RepID=UPI000A802AE0|nr:methyltransferase type 11 [Streptomyces avicenniae]
MPDLTRSAAPHDDTDTDTPAPWPRLLGVLRCPPCGGALTLTGRTLRCERRHTFDLARQGYAPLLAGGRPAATADTAGMVAARDAFLRSGHFAPLTDTLAARTAALCPPGGVLLDAGAGTGHYLAAVLDALPDDTAGLGLDTSVPALRRAARAHPRAVAASWDVWQPLPVRTGSVDVLLNVFAPRNGPEFHRVLSPTGALLVVTPTDRHLADLQRRLGLLSVDGAKDERLRNTLGAHFTRQEHEERDHALALDTDEVVRLVGMGPTARHVTEEELRDRAAGLGTPVEVTASFRVSVYRPRPA